MFASSNGKSKQGNEEDNNCHRRSSNAINLNDSEMTPENSSNNGRKAENDADRIRKDRAASRESLLSHRGSLAALKESSGQGKLILLLVIKDNFVVFYFQSKKNINF